MKHIDGNFKGIRNLNIYYQGWLPDKNSKAVLLVVHGLGEYLLRSVGGYQSAVTIVAGVLTLDFMTTSALSFVGLAGAGYAQGVSVYSYEWMAAVILVFFVGVVVGEDEQRGGQRPEQAHSALLPRHCRRPRARPRR